MGAIMQRHHLLLVWRSILAATRARAAPVTPHQCSAFDSHRNPSLPPRQWLAEALSRTGGCRHSHCMATSLVPRLLPEGPRAAARGWSQTSGCLCSPCLAAGPVPASCALPHWPRSAAHSSPVRQYSRESAPRTQDHQSEKLARLREKRKSRKVVEIKQKMTAVELAVAMDIDLESLYECLLMKTNIEDLRPTKVLGLDTIKVVLSLLDMTYSFASLHKEQTKSNKDAVKRPPPAASQLKPRPPVVTVMGHVDHGKTTLLDSLRKTSVVSGEAGGITQHIGAFLVPLPTGQQITFLDTPGHAAFSSMRERGANVTDIVILVVAADDSVMEQTRESIKYAQNAGVPIIVAINKCDKPGADPDFTKRDLMGHGIQLEEFGGDVQAVEISALKGTNLDALSESVVVLAELMELSCDPKGLVEASVIESRVDKGKGPVATAIVQRGTLKKGCILVSGRAQCRVRAMFNDRGQPVREVTPGRPVEVIGWKKLPTAGDLILEVESEKRAREVLKWREDQDKSQKLAAESGIIEERAAEQRRAYKERKQANSLLHWRALRAQRAAERFARPKENIKSGEPELMLVIKGDVDGSVEAILDALATYDCQQQCKMDVLSYGVGVISDKDVELAETFSGVVIGFNVTTSPEAERLAQERGVAVRLHSVIYRMLDDIKAQLSQRLPPKEVHDEQGEATVLQNFEISVGKRKVTIAGCRVNEGALHSSKMFKLIRNNETVHQGSLASLRHLKEDVAAVSKGMECGLRFQEQVEYRPGDTIICYDIQQVPQTIDWELGF